MLMKHRMFLSLLLAFLGILGVHAADESRKADVTFDNFGALVYSMDKVQTITWTDASKNASYDINYFAANKNSSGSLVLRKVKEGPGYVEFPSFGKKVEKIVITTPNTEGTARSVAIYDLNGTGGTEKAITNGTFKLNEAEYVKTVPIAEADQRANSIFRIVSTGSGNTEIAKIEFYFLDAAAVSPELGFDPKGPFKYSLSDSKSFEAPKFINPYGLPDITFESSNPNVLKVDASTGAVELGGSTGTAIITATFGGGSRNGVKYEAESVRYTFTVYDVTASIPVPMDQMDEGSLVGKKFQDDTKLVEFGFSKDSTSENIQYASGDKYIRFKPNTTVSIKVLEPGYVIEQVIVTNRNTTVLDPVEVSAGVYKTADATTRDNVWSFDGENVATATLKYVGNAESLGVSNIVVTLRKPKFTIAPKSAVVTVNKADANLDPVADYFTITNLTAGGSAADYIGALSFSIEQEKNVASTDGVNIILGNENGEAKVIAKYPEGDVYGATEASFTLNVTGKAVLTATVEDVTLAYKGMNGDLSKKAPIVLKNKDKEITEFKGAFTYKPDDENIATVDEEGLITAVAEGKTTVTVTYAGEDYEMAPAVINVTVEDLRTQPELKFTADKVIYLTNSKEAFVAPTLVNKVDDVQWKSDNEALATVDTNGNVTLIEGVTGKATITAWVEEGDTKGAEASYVIVVADPKGELSLNPAEQGYANGSINASVKNDDAELVSFAFNQGNESATRPSYAVASKTITFNNGNTLTVTSKNPAYYIAEVKIALANGTSLTTCTHPEGTELNADGSVWNFENADLQTAVLTNKGAAAQISNITVTLRLARLNLVANEATVAKQVGATVEVADYFTVTDHNGKPVKGVKINYTSSDVTKYPIVEDVINLTEAGEATITADIDATDTYEAASASFKLTVTENAPSVVVFKKDMAKTLNLYTKEGPASLKVRDQIETINGEALTEDLKIAIAKADAESKVITVDGDVITAGEVGEAEVTVTVPAIGGFAETTVSFFVNVVDNRGKLVLAFNPLTTSYDMNAGKEFVAPTLDLPEGFEGELTWTSDNENVAYFDENGDLKFKKVDGVQTVTITAEYVDYAVNKENWQYLPTSASYTIKVTGDAAWLDATPNLSGDVKVRGYIVGSIKNGNFKDSSKASFDTDNIAIALNKDGNNADNVVRVVLTGDNAKALNLQDNKGLIGSQIIVAGNARYAKEISTLSSYTLLKKVNYTLSSDSVPQNFATVVVNVPADFKGKPTIVVEPNPNDEVTVEGNVIKLKSKGLYTVKITNDESLPYLATTEEEPAELTLKVTDEVEAEDITFYFAHDPKTMAEGATPHIIIKSNKGVEYVGEGHELGKWHEMTPVADKYIGYDRQVYSYTAKVPLHELSENYIASKNQPQNAKRRAPSYDDEETKSTLITNGSSVDSKDKSNLNVYVGDGTATNEDGSANINDASVVSIPNAPVGGDYIYASSDENGKLYVWEVIDGKVTGNYVGVLENQNINSTNNLWSGEIPVENVTDLSIILSTGLTTDDNNEMAPAGTIFEATSANDGTELAKGITDYANWLNGEGKTLYNTCVKYCKDNKLSQEDAEKYMDANYYAEMFKQQESAIQTLKEVSGTESTYTPVNLNVSDLKLSNDQHTIYTSVELRRGVNGDNGVYAISFAKSADDLATDVEEIEAADVDGEVMWFNLQGERLAQPTEGIMIRVQGNKAQKVLIRH